MVDTIMEEQVINNKEKNKNMLKAIAIEGGTAFTILFSFMLITVIAKNANPKPQSEINEEVASEIKVKGEEFYNSLKYIANEQFKESFSLSTTNMCINKIYSFTTTSNGIEYCSEAENNGTKSILNINIELSNKNIDQIVPLINEHYESANYFAITTEVMDEYENSNVKSEIINKHKPAGDEYVTCNLYKSVNPNEKYACLTYFDSARNGYVSYNKIVFQEEGTTIKYLNDEEYFVNADTNEITKTPQNRALIGFYNCIINK